MVPKQKLVLMILLIDLFYIVVFQSSVVHNSIMSAKKVVMPNLKQFIDLTFY